VKYKTSLFILSRLTTIEGIFMFLSAGISLIYHENDLFFLGGIGFALVLLGLFVSHLSRSGKGEMGRKEAYFVVSATWILFSLFGALPFYFTGHIPSYTDAFFETMSGFTTTGASILNNIETLPHGLLFWRSIIQWLGGMGIIVLSLAVLSLLNVGGMQLFTAEVPGPTTDKLHPRIQGTAKRLWFLYVGYTVAETILLSFGGMSLFDAVCHSFTTMATGGFSTKQASIAHFNSPFIDYVIIVFMFIAGTNFSLGYFAFNLKFSKVFKNQELKTYILLIVLASVFIAVSLIAIDHYNPEWAIRSSLFQTVSLMTTTGFATDNYILWPSFTVYILFLIMFIGGSAGSTAGGIKIVRVLLVLKNGFLELKRLLHPNAVIPVKFNGVVVKPGVMSNILAFVTFYIIIFALGTIVISAQGYNLDTSMGAVIASLSNIGPGLGGVGPMENFSHFNDFGKWFLSFLMLIGRLEIFTVFVIFTRAYWKN
jgi:trk system potassium uptake protein TrkH